MSKATEKRLYLTRHAEGHHNVDDKAYIRDAKLTDLGVEQAKHVHPHTSSSIQQTAELLVASIQRRPIRTMMYAYPDLRARLDKEGKPPIILDILQEATDDPSDTPLDDVEDIKADPTLKEYLKDAQFVMLGKVNHASNEGIFDPKKINERATKIREWLLARPEKEIVVAAHGTILTWVADAANSGREWTNAEVKIFTFATEDPTKPLRELDGSHVKPVNEWSRDKLEEGKIKMPEHHGAEQGLADVREYGMA